MGTMILAAGTQPGRGHQRRPRASPAYTFLILAVLIGLFYVLIMRPQRNRQRKAAQTQSQVMPGQRIRTTAGMYGTVVSGDDRDVVFEIAPGVQVTMLRRAIMDVSVRRPAAIDRRPSRAGRRSDDDRDVSRMTGTSKTNAVR